MSSKLDWSAHETSNAFGFGDAFGDAFAAPETPGGGYGNALATCTGKQHCLRTDQEVMCPSYRLTRAPEHSPYHRARVLSEALAADPGDGSAFAADGVQAALELCVGCKGCKRECPNGMDIALAATEARARARTHASAPSLRDRLFAELPDQVGRLRRWRLLVRLVESVPGLRRLVRRSVGLSPDRRLPVPTARSFEEQHPLMSYGDGTRGDVVLFADTFSKHFEPEIAESALGLLVGLGYRVHLPRPATSAGSLCCGRTFLSQGRIEEARVRAAELVDTLAPYVDAGMPIIGLEPSCLLMLRDEYRALGLGARVGALAKQALLLEEFLDRLTQHDPDALPMAPMFDRQILVHGHCHQKAFGTMPAVERSLKRIPGVFVTPIQSGCCGMAGAFGYEIEHHDLSMRMAEESLLPAVRNAPTGAVIVANGTSCRQQIRDATGRRALHLAEVLYRQFDPAACAPEDVTSRAT